MPLRDKSGIGERIPRELIDGDFAVAFTFVEMAQEESRLGNQQVALRLLENSEQKLNEIRERLVHLTAAQQEAFATRCTELGEAIKRAKSPNSASGIS